MNAFAYSPAGFALTESMEGLRLQAYQDIVGVWTVGYGHTGAGVTPGMTITQAQAEALLESDIAACVVCVNGAVTFPGFNQNQFDALVDFSFNVGRGAFLGSSLLRLLNGGNVQAAALQFVDQDDAGQYHGWVYAAGVVQPGLVRRREAEKALFLQEVA